MAIRLGSTHMTGLNMALKTAFYPHYSYTKAIHGHSTPLQFPHEDTYKSGRIRGKAMDKLTDEMVLKAKNNEDWQNSFTGIFQTQLVDYLKRNALFPVASQYPLFDSELRMGTHVDLVCKTTSGKFVLFENKVGYEASLERHTLKPMRAPFETLNDSPLNQMHLYVAFIVRMFKKQYPMRELDESLCAILRMSPNGLDIFSYRPDLDVESGANALRKLRDLTKRDRLRLNRNQRKRK